MHHKAHGMHIIGIYRAGGKYVFLHLHNGGSACGDQSPQVFFLNATRAGKPTSQAVPHLGATNPMMGRAVSESAPGSGDPALPPG